MIAKPRLGYLSAKAAKYSLAALTPCAHHNLTLWQAKNAIITPNRPPSTRKARQPRQMHGGLADHTVRGTPQASWLP